MIIFCNKSSNTQFESKAIEVIPFNQFLEKVKGAITFRFVLLFYSGHVLDFHDDDNENLYLLSGY